MPHARSELRAALAGGVRLWIQQNPPVLLLIAKQDARVALEVAPMSDPCPATFAPAAHDSGAPDCGRMLLAPDSRISWPRYTPHWDTIRRVLDVDLLEEAVRALEDVARTGFGQMLDAHVRASACPTDSNLIAIDLGAAPRGTTRPRRRPHHAVWL
jgi:hypothetical protein